jgi:hypothetical protein
MLGSKVLDKDKGHSGVGGKVLQKLRECLQSSGGSADADDGERRHL